MHENLVEEPPVKPDIPIDDPDPEKIEPMYKCRLCPFTDPDPNQLCDPVRIA